MTIKPIIVEWTNQPISVDLSTSLPIVVAVQAVGAAGVKGDDGAAADHGSASPGSTDAVPEGVTNLYHTATRVNALISASVGSVTQAWNATLDALAAVATTTFGRSLLAMASAAALRTAVALPNTTVAGRLARYTDTAGALDQTAGLYEDGAGNVAVGNTSPSQMFTVGATNQFTVGSNGDITARSLSLGGVAGITGATVINRTTNGQISIQGSVGFSTPTTNIVMANGTCTTASGQYNAVAIQPTYNQSATAAATDLLINRTETAVGSGAQKLIDAQVGSVSKFSVSNNGSINTQGTAYFKAGTSGGTASSTHGEMVLESAEGNFGFEFLGTATSNQRLGFSDPTTVRGRVEYDHTGNYMAFWVEGAERIRVTATAVGIGTTSPTAGFALDVTGSIRSSSVVAAVSAMNAPAFRHGTTGGSILIQNTQSFSVAATSVAILQSSTYTNSSGTMVGVALQPTYNQSGTAAATDLLINRTETAVGSGAQKLIDAQVGSVSQFSVMNNGNVGVGVTPTTGLDSATPIRARTYTVATLPSAAAVGAGAHTYVTDANVTFAAGIGTTVAGGGANFARVTSNGTNWIIM